MTVAFAVTAYKESSPMKDRFGNLSRCLEAALHNDDIFQIVISNDSPEDHDELQSRFPNAYVSSNDPHLHVFLNKIEAVFLCHTDWVITCDSDNLFSPELIKRIIDWTEKTRHDTWLCPSFAKPNFDYRELCGNWNGDNLEHLIAYQHGSACMNTGNQTVHRETFTKVFQPFRKHLKWVLDMPNPLNVDRDDLKTEPWWLSYNACDSAILNLLWMEAGNTIAVTPGFEYDHKYSDGEDSNFIRAPEDKWELGKQLLLHYVDLFKCTSPLFAAPSTDPE